ncbi:hypothetical protein ACILE2_11130 [Capnocytophaga canimorsus]|uniref:hypothetical protein n=1 Tax=Capnocytophaga canimorsus TaxID=28188 RepID=UPI0037CFD6A2
MRLQTTQNIGSILGNLKKDVYEAYRENLPKRKMTRAEQTQNETVVRCVRPQLNSEAMAITMDNYRAFVAEYNEKIRKTNAVIAKHNAELVPESEYTQVQQVLKNVFLGKYGTFETRFCPKTIVNHRHRFEEAGILIDYQNLGSGKFGGVLYHINPAILVIFEAKTGRFAVAENQSLVYGLEKKVTDITMNNIQEQKNKSEIKANVNNNSPKRSSLSLTKFRIQEPSLQEHQLQGADLNQGGGGENVKKTPENVKNDTENQQPADKRAQLAQMLLKTTLHPTDLCEQLAKGVFNSYKVIDIRILQAEANAGILTPEEFFEVVIQDLLKQSAKLYIGKTVHRQKRICWYLAKCVQSAKRKLFPHLYGGCFPKIHYCRNVAGIPLAFGLCTPLLLVAPRI